MMPLGGGAQAVGGATVLTRLGLFLALAFGQAFRGPLNPMQPSRFRKRED